MKRLVIDKAGCTGIGKWEPGEVCPACGYPEQVDGIGRGGDTLWCNRCWAIWHYVEVPDDESAE